MVSIDTFLSAVAITKQVAGVAMAAKLMTIAATFVHAPPGASSARTVLLPFPSMPWTAHEFAAGTASSGSTRALTTIDRRCGRRAWSGRLRYCRLIGRYRSIPSCNRPAFLRLVRLLTVLIIAASAMCQTKSLVTNGPIERSVGMNAALSVAAPCAFVPVLRQGRSSDTRTRSATVATHRRKYAAELTTGWCL
jgi:hypothetical protein